MLDTIIPITTIVVVQLGIFFWYPRLLRNRYLSQTVDQIAEISRLSHELRQVREETKASLTQWQDMALAFEVFCDCAVDGDLEGAQNAARAINTARENLRRAGEYDD